jgi:hypothetical protein
MRVDYRTQAGVEIKMGSIYSGLQGRDGGPVEILVFKGNDVSMSERVCFSARECGLEVVS